MTSSDGQHIEHKCLAARRSGTSQHIYMATLSKQLYHQQQTGKTITQKAPAAPRTLLSMQLHVLSIVSCSAKHLTFSICDTTDIAKRVKQTVISYYDTSCHVQTAAYDSDLLLQCSIYNMHCMQLPQHTRREDNWFCLMCDILWVGQLIF